MKKQSFLSLSLLLILSLALLNCDKKKDDLKPGTGTTTPPTTVSTAPALDNAASATTSSGITANAAKMSSTISANGGAAITQYGHVLLDTKTEPTTADAKTELGKTDGPFPLKFTSDLKSLKANTTYNVRPYATNDKGTTYGTAVQVKTTTAVVVAGEINGTWVERAKFPASSRGSFKLVSANNKLYLIAGYSRLDKQSYYDAWEYDPATDKSTKRPKQPLPGLGMPFLFHRYPRWYRHQEKSFSHRR